MSREIHLLGHFSVHSNEKSLHSLNTSRLPPMLAFLALSGYAPVSRRQVAFRIWPDSSEKQAYTNLRKLLHNLRNEIPDLIQVDTHSIKLLGDVDVVKFMAALELASRHQKENHPEAEQAALECATNLYQGDLLPECYDDWLIPERESLRQKFIFAGDRLLTLLEMQQHYREAVACANRMLHADPLREETYGQLIRLHALNGDRAAALSVYHHCARVLGSELGVEPNSETRRLYERLLNNERALASPALPIAHPLIGRENEWQAIQVEWRRAVMNGIRLMLLKGEAGIGKTRLAEDALSWANRQGYSTASVMCFEGDQSSSFVPLVAWLRSRPLNKLEPRLRYELSRLLPGLLKRSDPHPPPITEGWQRQAFLESLTEALVGDEVSLFLLFDDIHWCDRDTLNWIANLISTRPAAKILLVATLREEEIRPNSSLNRLLRELQLQDKLTELTLTRLTEEQTAALVVSIGGYEISDSVIYRETEGVPLFIVEMARHGIESLMAGDWHLMEYSPRVQAVLAGRLERLSFPARAVAQSMAILGREFNIHLITAVSNLTEAEAMLALDELWQRRMLRDAGEGKYYFSHAYLRDAALADLSPVRLRWLHRQAARALEPDHIDLPTIAEHYAAAGEPDLAVEAYSKAARHAFNLFELETARNLAEQALALAGRPSFLLHETYGDVLNLMGLRRAASEAYGQALVACQTQDWLSQARLHRRILESISRLDYDQARSAYQQGAANLLKAPESDDVYWTEWLELQLSWLRANYWEQNTTEMTRLLELMEEPIRLHGTLSQIIQNRHSSLQLHLITHRYTTTAQQVEIARQNVELARELKSPFELAERLSSLGFVAYFAGEFEECESAYQACITTAVDHGFMSVLERAYVYLSLSYRRRGWPGQVSDLLYVLEDIVSKTQTLSYRSLLLAQRAWLAYLGDDFLLAKRLASNAIQGWEMEKPPYPVQWPGRIVLFTLLVHEGNLGRVREQTRALLSTEQQCLNPDLEAMLQAGLLDTGSSSTKKFHNAVEIAAREGYL
jgi:DNA-binding SARP family transcriptional activator